MSIKTLHIFSVIIVLITTSVFAQDDIGWFNSGSVVYVNSSDSIYVRGDQGSAHVVHKNFALCDNRGVIALDGDWLDSNTNPTFWDQDSGIVRMTGRYQRIAGTNVTDFHSLQLFNPMMKEMFIDANVDGVLDLNDAELALNKNILHLQNPEPSALSWNGGFVSGDTVGGYFARSTNRTAAYMFPVGSINLTNTYRAVELTPTTSDASVFAVRLADRNPDLENNLDTSFTGSFGPFNRSDIGPQLYGVNDAFYHHIARFSGTSEALADVFYFGADEIYPYEFNIMAVWENSIPQWERDDFAVNFNTGRPSIGNPERFMRNTISNFGNDVYALAVRDKITARVPQIFSPNNDGINDELFVLGTEIEELEFIVYNRWGEKVFETKDQNIGWNGKFRGSDAQPGVYVFYLKAGLVDNQILEQSGDITLVR